MKWLIVGALLALMLLFPALGTLALGMVVALVSEPLAIAFGLGLAVGVHLHRKGWAR